MVEHDIDKIGSTISKHSAKLTLFHPGLQNYTTTQG